MVRPKKNQPGYEESVNKWRNTMLKKYGSQKAWREKLKENGSKGGRLSSTGGFYNNPELARRAGAIGGLLSRRGRSYNEEWLKHGAEMLAMYDSGEYSIADIVRKFNLNYSTVLYRIKQSKKGDL